MCLPDQSKRYWAHTLEGRPSEDWEPLETHLEKVAESAAEFAAAFGAREWGRVVGLCHDLGKFSDEFQSYIRVVGADSEDAGVEEAPFGKRVDHSTYGARVVQQAAGGILGQILAFCIAGHHAGLADESSTDELSQRGTLRYRLDAAKYRIPAVAPPGPPVPALKLPFKPASEVPFQIAFFTRMLFSCLVDADRTRTEEFC